MDYFNVSGLVKRRPLILYLLKTYPRSSVFWVAFIFVLSAGLTIQLLLLPSVSSLHAGHGLLKGGDWVWFHEEAAVIARKMLSGGWSAWNLRASGNTPIGLTAALYFVTGIYEPWLVLPVNAFFFALSTLFLYELAALLTEQPLAKLLATLPFLCFFSAATIYGQIHKDVFSIAGVLLVVLSLGYLVRLGEIDRSSVLTILGLISVACVLVWSVRPYLLLILFVGGVSGLALVCAIWGRSRTRLWWLAILSSTLILCAGAGTNFLPNAPRNPIAFQLRPMQPISPTGGSWIENKILGFVLSIDYSRQGFSDPAGSNIDTQVRLDSIGSLLAYLPRALQIGVLAPFPNSWLSSSSHPGGAIMRTVSAFEMAVSYVLLVGLIFGLLRQKWRNPVLWIVLYLTLFFILLQALAIPNVGALYRMRYGAWQLLNALGVIGFVYLYQDLKEFVRRSKSIR
jgi:hypothetical protein